MKPIGLSEINGAFVILVNVKIKSETTMNSMKQIRRLLYVRQNQHNNRRTDVILHTRVQKAHWKINWELLKHVKWICQIDTRQDSLVKLIFSDTIVMYYHTCDNIVKSTLLPQYHRKWLLYQKISHFNIIIMNLWD